MPDQTDLQNLMHDRRRLLEKLQAQQAKMGLHTPAHILNEIEDIEQELDRLARQQQAGPAAPDDDFLAAAYRLLAQQPTDAVPDVAPLPPGSRLPWAANPLFVGRQADLMDLARSLTGDRPAVISQAALTGLGGIGKTQLAVEYAHRYGQYFAGGVFWLNFAQAEAIPAEIALCGGPAGLGLYPDQTGLSLPDQVALVRSAWQSPLPRLLIFDNCEDEALLAHYRPTSGGGRILVTSRRSRWSRALGVTTVKLATLARADSIALLLKFRPDLGGGRGSGAGGREVSPPQDKGGQGSRLSRPARILPPPSLPPSTSSGRSRLGGGANTSPPAGGTEGGQIWANPTSPPLKGLGGPPATDPQPPIPDPLDALASELGDLPLALHLAGSFLETYQHAAFGTPAAYLAELRRASLDHPSLTRDDRTLTTAHDRHVARTFAVSYDRLDPQVETDALAGALLARAAHFAPGEAIPRPLLLATLDGAEDDPNAALLAEDGLGRLIELGLIDPEPDGALRLHRLIAHFARTAAADDTAQTAVETTLLAEAGRLNNAGYPAPLLAWQAHLVAITEAALLRADEAAANLCNELGYHLDMVGSYAAARPYYERALAIRQQVLGPDHPDTALSLNNLGYLWQAMGDYAAARPYIERALAIRQQVLGADHPATAQSLNNLGALLDTMGDYAAARPYYERALAINEQVLGADHPDTARSLNNLGALWLAIGDYTAARPYYERALAIYEQVLGPDHPDTALSLNNLGGLLDSMGDYAAARPFYERALAIRRQVLGADHPDTARSLNNLGYLLQAMGDYAAARPFYERALAIRQQVLGADHPDTAQSLNNLGYLLQVLGDYAAARPYYEQALAIFEQVLGADHPDTASSLNNLGALLRATGDYAAARPYYERALAIRQQVLGPDHPDTARSLNNLGYLLKAMGDYAAARPYFERALAIYEQVLGADHPDTALSLNNLGYLWQAMGDYAAARPYYERALAIRRQVLGADHPDTARSLNNLGYLLKAMGDYAAARPYYERALAIYEQVLGADHPDTATSLNNLGALLDTMGDYAAARPYYERALAIFERKLGPNHPTTQIVRDNLAALG